MSNMNINDTVGRSNSAPVTSNLDKLADSYLNKIGCTQSVALDTSLLPDFINRYLAIAGKQTDAIPGALISAWLPAVAVNIGNRVFIRGNGKNHYCQIWSVLVGPSSVSRKSTCIRLANRTLLPYLNTLKPLAATERMERELVISNATNAKMISLLAANPIRLFEFHEFGSLLKNATHSYNAGMKENLTSLYDGDSKTICNMERTERIIKPAICISGASTEGWIYNGFQSAAEQGSGFLQRFIYCLIKPEGKRICSSLEEQELSYAGLYAYESIFTLFRSIPGNCKLKLSREMRRIWLTEHDRVLNGILAKEDEELLAYATRIYNNVFCALVIIFTLMKSHVDLRLATEHGPVATDILSVTDCAADGTSATTRRLSPESMQRLAGSVAEGLGNFAIKKYIENLEVSQETIEEALYLCSYYLENARPMLTIISEGGAWNNERRIIKHLSKQPEQKDTHSNIMNALRLKSKELKECLCNLLEQNAISTEIPSSEGTYKKPQVYRVLPAAQELYS